jgi:hypothetical protein
LAANAASIERPAGSRDSAVSPPGRGLGAAGYGYLLAMLAIVLGFIVTRRYELVDPLNGVGYWLGIVGATLMATLLLYPVRKRLRILQGFGATRHWFRMHMIFGVLGPILILYHSNFSLGSLNSNVALACTLLVAASGLVGRYLYTKIFADLEGHRRSLQELSERAQLTPEQRARATALAPELMQRLNAFDGLVLTPPRGFWSSVLLPGRLAVTTRLGYLRLAWYARREIRRTADRTGIGRVQRKRAQQGISRLLAEHLRRVRRVAGFHSYERLFSLWHVFHLPFFYILVLTALLHVLAVHMY